MIAKTTALSAYKSGCGYGAIVETPIRSIRAISYRAPDIADEMGRAASICDTGSPTARFGTAVAPRDVADYGIAGGMFDVCQRRTDSEWLAYRKDMLDILNTTGIKGSTSNGLISHSYEDRRHADLDCTEPFSRFDCYKLRYLGNVAFLHVNGFSAVAIFIRKPL